MRDPAVLRGDKCDDHENTFLTPFWTPHGKHWNTVNFHENRVENRQARGQSRVFGVTVVKTDKTVFYTLSKQQAQTRFCQFWLFWLFWQFWQNCQKNQPGKHTKTRENTRKTRVLERVQKHVFSDLRSDTRNMYVFGPVFGPLFGPLFGTFWHFSVLLTHFWQFCQNISLTEVLTC